MQFIGELSGKAGRDPSLLFSEEWQFDMESQMIVLSLYTDSIRNELKPSRPLEAHHDVMVEMADKIDEFVILMSTGIEEVDETKILLAAGIMHDLPDYVRLIETTRQVYCN